MAIATKIIEPAFTKTKEALFPINKKYWLKMGIVSLASGGNYASSGGNSGGNSSLPEIKNISFQDAVSNFNIEALKFLNSYGWILGIIVSVFYLFGLFISYINSVLYFVFIEGVVTKEISVRKSFSKNKAIGGSLFLFRVIFGIVSLIAVLICLSPAISAFLNNRLAYFNLWLLLPIIPGIILVSIISGIISFIAEDFLVVIMYLKNIPIKTAFDYFKKIAANKKMEVFLYWVLKIPLSVGGAIIGAIITIILLIAYIIIAVVLGLIITALYFISKALLIPLIIIGVLLLFLLIMLYIVNLAIFLLPVRVFFQYYAILMVESLDRKNTELKKEESTIEIKPKKTSEEKKAIPKKPKKVIKKK